jgi:hypothetical protein
MIMIVSHNFTEALEQYQLGVLPFRLLQEQATLLIEYCEEAHETIADSQEITEADIAWLSDQPESEEDYEGFLGGNFHICESPEDLLAIEGCDLAWAKSHDGHWPNVTDLPMSWDSCRYVSETDAEPNWVLFLLCGNNAGGDTYFVPKHLWQLARVEEHMAATNEFWG